MPKGKIKINTSDQKKLVLAAELNEVSLIGEESKTIGETLIAVVTFKTPSQLFQMGRDIDKIKE